MDRLDAMRVFVAALDEGSLAGAARALNRSPAAVSRAIAFLEKEVGAELLHRTTRVMRLSAVGERYASACRRILSDLEEAELLMAGEQSAPRGVLTLAAQPLAGEKVLQPIVDAFLDAYPSVSVRVLFLERPVNLAEEGVDLALRIGELPDSALVAIKVAGDVRRVIVGSPAYLDSHAPVRAPADLAEHQIIAMDHFGVESWDFGDHSGSSAGAVSFRPRIAVNSGRAALSSALDGMGLTRLYCYTLSDLVCEGRLRVVLADREPPREMARLIGQASRMSTPKVRAFIDFAAPRLRRRFTSIAEALQTASAATDRCDGQDSPRSAK
jgi:DNA-binding transcriptional LysR family regulator